MYLRSFRSEGLALDLCDPVAKISGPWSDATPYGSSDSQTVTNLSANFSQAICQRCSLVFELGWGLFCARAPVSTGDAELSWSENTSNSVGDRPGKVAVGTAAAFSHARRTPCLPVP